MDFSKNKVLLLFLLVIGRPVLSFAQLDFQKPFKDCNVNGSIIIYDLKKDMYYYSDTSDYKKETLPASTFKIINLAIALETGVVKDVDDVVKWVGSVDTNLYGYRPEIYKDLSVRQAFELSAGWVFVELAKKIGRDNYKEYLEKCQYGNGDLSEQGTDFWNFGKFGISPKNQVQFLTALYNGELPFSARTMKIVKEVMVTEKTDNYTIKSKTGWSRDGGIDNGWWVGYVENKEDVYFFATRLIKDRKVKNPDFSNCRKDITKTILKQLNAIN